MSRRDVIRSRIWEEESELDNPFVARTCYCSGYDVFGDLLGKIGWTDYLHLLFRAEPANRAQLSITEGLAVVLANPGPREPSVRAAMCAGVGGSTYASSLMAALAVGAGQNGGARELALFMEAWRDFGTETPLWLDWLGTPQSSRPVDIWPELEHPPGFDPNGVSCATPVLQAMDYLASLDPDGPLRWLRDRRPVLEAAAGLPMSMVGLAATALWAAGFDPRAGEMLYLLLRLPGAAAHALEQERYGWRRFPLFSDAVQLAEPQLGPGEGVVAVEDAA